MRDDLKLDAELVDTFLLHLAQKLGRSAEEIADKGLKLRDFHGKSVRVRLDDGSECLFNHAFYVIDKERQLIGVFTEHCGNHIFHLAGTRVKEVPPRRLFWS